MWLQVGKHVALQQSVRQKVKGYSSHRHICIMGSMAAETHHSMPCTWQLQTAAKLSCSPENASRFAERHQQDFFSDGAVT
jgi:hypothetical protein